MGRGRRHADFQTGDARRLQAGAGGVRLPGAATGVTYATEVDLARDRGLRRAIGPLGLAAAIVNVVVGAGVFVLPAAMARAAGGSALWAYAACAVVMGAVVLCCAEAGSRVPTSGGLYGYVDAAFGPLAGFVSGVLLWLSCVLACGGIASALADALGRLSPALASPAARAGVIVLAVGGPAALNALGVRTASRVIAVATAVKLIPLALFVVVGGWVVLQTPAAAAPAGPPVGLGGVGRAALLALFAFQGMETALGASGEVDRPARNLPVALTAAMALVLALYVAVQLTAQGLLGPALGASSAPLADAMARVDGRLGRLVALGAAVSMAAWIGSDLLGAPRVLFAFARDGHLPAWLGRLTRRGVPGPAIAVHAVVAVALALTGAFEQLAVLSVLAACGLYIAACLAAWRLARRGVAELGPPLRLPGLPAAAAAGVLGMAAAVALARPAEIAGFVGAVAVSAALYALRRGRRPRLSAPTR